MPEEAVYGVAIGAVLVGDDDYVNSFSSFNQLMDDVDSIFE